MRDDANGARLGYERSASAQRLVNPGAMTDRPSRADSRVTFAPDTVEKTEPPIPPARSRDHVSAKQDIPRGGRSSIAAEATDKVNSENTRVLQSRELISLFFLGTQRDAITRKERSPKPVAMTVTISPPVVEEDAKPRPVPVPRERRSLSPKLSEENRKTASQHLLPTANTILKRQTAVVNESTVSLPSNPQTMPREDYENALHGSSEFMLVLYPDDETREKDAANDAIDRVARYAGKHERVENSTRGKLARRSNCHRPCDRSFR